MTPNQSISSLVDRVREQQRGGAVPKHGGQSAGEVVLMSRAAVRCPSCSSVVTRYATNCRACGELLIRASA